MPLDITQVKTNIQKMLDQGASEQEVDTYLAGEGVPLIALQQASPIKDATTVRHGVDVSDVVVPFADTTLEQTRVITALQRKNKKPKIALEGLGGMWDKAVERQGGQFGISPETRKALGGDGPVEALRPITDLPANIADLGVAGLQGLGAVVDTGAQLLDEGSRASGLADLLSFDGNKFLPGSAVMALGEAFPMGGAEAGLVGHFATPKNDILSPEVRTKLNQEADALYNAGATSEEMQTWAKKNGMSPFDQEELDAALSKRGPVDRPATAPAAPTVEEPTAPATAREAGNTEPAPSSVGSFGPKDVANPEISQAVSATNIDLPTKTIPKNETNRLGDELGLSRDTYGEGGSIGEISPIVARGLTLTKETATDVLAEFAETGSVSTELRSQLEDVAGTTSENLGETGRALNMANDGSNGLSPKVAQEFVTLVDEVKGDPKKTAALQKAANLYKDDPAAVARIVADSKKRDILDILTSVRYNGMLSSLKTQVYNLVGYVNAGVKKAAEPVGITLDKALSPALDKIFPDSKGKPKLTYKGSVASLLPDPSGTVREAISAAVSGFKTGQPRHHIDIQNISRGRQKAMPWEIPRKMMAATDEFFDTILERQERTARAVAYATKEGLEGKAHSAKVEELVNQARTTTKNDAIVRARVKADSEGLTIMEGMTPTQRTAVKKQRQERIQQLVEEDAPYQIQKGAEEYSALMRFQSSTKVGEFLSRLTGRKENFHDVPFHAKPIELFKWSVQQIFPFANTTQNLIREGLRSYTPLALPMNLKGLSEGGVARQRALSNMALGATATALVAPLLQSGSLTGEGPRDYAEKQKLELTGWRPNSYKNKDGNYVSYKGLDPVSVALSSMATVYERAGSEDPSAEAVGKAVGNLFEVFSKNTWAQSMTTISDLLENSSQGNTNTTRVAADMAASFVTPAIVRDISDATTGDHRQVDLKGDGTFATRVLDQVKKTWFQSASLPQKVDALGQPMKKDEVIGPDFLSRVTTSPTSSDPVVVELTKLQQLPSPIDKGDLSKMSATRPQVLAYQELSGKYIHDYLSDLITTSEWSSMSAEEKSKEIKEVEKDMRKAAREDLFPEFYGKDN